MIIYAGELFDWCEIMAPNPQLRQGVGLLVLTGVGFIIYGLMHLYSAFFGQDFEMGVGLLGGATRANIATSTPDVIQFIDHLHIVLAGVLFGLGIAIVALAWYGILIGHRWALAITFIIAGLPLAMNFLIHYDPGFSYDRVAHITPSVLVTLLLLGGVARAYQGLSFETSST